MALLIFALGLAVGSFLNAYIFRTKPSPVLRTPSPSGGGEGEGRQLPLPAGEGWGEGKSVWHGRSYCPQCKKTLRWYELIPLVSFALQAGRCRGCRKKIDWQYPLVELVTGILFVLVFYQIWNLEFRNWDLFRISDFGFRILIPWYLLSVLVILFVYDLRFGLVPDRVALPAIAIAFIYRTFSNSRELENGLLLATYYLLLATAVGAAFFAAQYYFSRGRWLGAGDIRIGALMGAMLGWPLIFVGITISYFIGGAVGILLLAFGKKKFGQTLPLGTFLTLGTTIVFLYGEQIWRAYWR